MRFHQLLLLREMKEEEDDKDARALQVADI
jgi:hypothetical protein